MMHGIMNLKNRS